MAMMKKILVLALILLIGATSFSQEWKKNHHRESYEKNNKSRNSGDDIEDQGFNFIIAGGCYFGDKYNAQYYNGSLENENNLGYIFGNKYWYDEINRTVQNYYPYISDSVYLGGPLGNMSYKVSVFIQLGVKYRLTKNWGIQLTYSYAHLIANGGFRLLYNAPAGNIGNRTGMLDNQYMVGREDRSMFDLSACYVFTTKSIVKPYLEAGLQFNFVRVKKMEAYFYDDNKNKILTFDVLNNYQQNVPGVQSDGMKVRYGGPGFGFSACAGLKIAFNKVVSIDPNFYFSASKFGLEGYKDKFSCNFGVLIRFVFNS